MGRTYSTHGEMAQMRILYVWSENLRRKDLSEDLGVYGKIILESIFRKLEL
jgi:hypothetical protein